MNYLTYLKLQFAGSFLSKIEIINQTLACVVPFQPPGWWTWRTDQFR